MIKIETFENEFLNKLEYDINLFLSKNLTIKLIDIKFNSVFNNDTQLTEYSAMIIYKSIII